MRSQLAVAVAFVGLTGGYLVAVTPAASATAVTATSEATGYQMDAAHDGVQPVSTLGPDLSEAWSSDLGGAASYPVVVGTDVYAGADGAVVALSAASGDRLWSTSVAGTYPYLAYDSDTLFVESDGDLYALNPSDGDIEWSSSEGQLNGPPVAADGVVVGQSSNGPVAFNEATGQLEWASDYGGTGNYGTVPAIAGSSVLFDGGTFTGAYALASGSKEWAYTYRSEDYQGASPAYAGGVLYSTGTGLQLEASSGTLNGVISSYFTPAVDGQRTFAEPVDPNTGVTSDLVALDNVTGDALWKANTGGQVAVAPAVANGYVVTATTGGQVTMWAEATGKQVWTGAAGADIPESPADPRGLFVAPVTSLAIAGDELFVPTDSGLVAFVGQGPNSCSPEGCPDPVARHRSGTPTSATDSDVSYLIQSDHTDAQPSDPLTVPTRQLWTHSLGAPAAYPLIVDGRVFVVAGDWLWAFDGATGRVDWGPVDTDGGQLAYDSQSLFLVNSAGWIMSFNPVTGARNWIQAIPVDFDGLGSSEDSYEQPPIAAGGILYAVGSSPLAGLYPFSESNGQPLAWDAVSTASTGGTPAVSDGDLYAAYVVGDAYELNPAGPNFVWQNTGNGSGGTSLAPAVYAGDVWATGYELNATNGASVGELPIGNPELQPAFVGPQAIFPTPSGAIEATSLSLQSEWTFDGDGELDTNPVADRTDVFVGSRSGHLYAVNLVTGTVDWQATLPSPISTPAANTAQPAGGLGLGDGLLVVPSADSITVFGD